jgi:murein endopeptidase
MKMVKSALLGLLIALMVPSLPAQEKIELGEDVEVYALKPGIWRHVTSKTFEKKWKAPANGLIVVDGKHAVMIDTPWTPEQTALLLDWVERSLQARVIVPGHGDPGGWELVANTLKRIAEAAGN